MKNKTVNKLRKSIHHDFCLFNIFWNMAENNPKTWKRYDDRSDQSSILFYRHDDQYYVGIWWKGVANKHVNFRFNPNNGRLYLDEAHGVR